MRQRVKSTFICREEPEKYFSARFHLGNGRYYSYIAYIACFSDIPAPLAKAGLYFLTLYFYRYLMYLPVVFPSSNPASTIYQMQRSPRSTTCRTWLDRLLPFPKVSQHLEYSQRFSSILLLCWPRTTFSLGRRAFCRSCYTAWN